MVKIAAQGLLYAKHALIVAVEHAKVAVLVVVVTMAAVAAQAVLVAKAVPVAATTPVKVTVKTVVNPGAEAHVPVVPQAVLINATLHALGRVLDAAAHATTPVRKLVIAPVQMGVIQSAN